MIDSCRPRNDDPGFAAAYSKPSDFSTSTMKSLPGRSTVYAAPAGGGSISDVICAGEGGGADGRDAAACCALTAGALTTSAAADAAPFRNPRRLTVRPFGFAMAAQHTPYVAI